MCSCKNFYYLCLFNLTTIITISKVENLTVNLNNQNSSKNEEQTELANDFEKMEILVETLRIIALDKFFLNKTIVIPDGCEKYGLVQGEFDLPKFLYFIGDMLEE